MKTNLRTVLSQLSTIFVVGYLVTAVLVLVAAPILAFRWSGSPYPGFFVDPTLRISPYKSIQEIALNSKIKIIAIDGQEVQTVPQYTEILSTHSSNDEVQLTVVDPQGDVLQPTVRLRNMSIVELVIHTILPFLISLSSLITGVWVFAFRRRNVSGKVFSIFATSVSLAVSLLFDANTSHVLVSLWMLGLCLGGGSFFAIALFFPESDPIGLKRPDISALFFIPSIILYLYTMVTLKNRVGLDSISIVFLILQAYLIISYLFFLFWMYFRWKNSSAPKSRDQLRLILIGIGGSFLIPVIWAILSLFIPTIPFSPLLLATIPFFSILIASSLSRQNLLRTDYIARQTLMYSTLTFLTILGYGFLVTGISLIFGGTLDMSNPVLIGILVFTLSITILPIRERLQKYIDQAFNRNQDLFRQQIQNFSHNLTQSSDAVSLNLQLRQILSENFNPGIIHVFISDPGGNHFLALPDENDLASSELIFSLDSGLVKVLSSRRAPVFVGDAHSIPAILVPELSRLNLLGAILYIPLPGRKRLIGWIALGAQKSNRSYNQQDLEFLETLSDQAALAFERAQAVANLEQRVHQMTVLNRITQGINLTTTFDDILELIYAQSNQILPTRDFEISLIDKRTNALSTIFAIKNDERSFELEKMTSLETGSVEAEVIKLGRAIVTQDLERECRSRGVAPSKKGIFAWIGVPLNTGSETIGVLSLGNRNPVVFYSDDQAELLQAIADQAAVAIVKAELLNEAERRARQLTLLNEVTRKMSTTLELVPLSNTILKNAVEIVNSQAGVLLLFDSETGEYIVEAALGNGNEKPVGSRMPPSENLISISSMQKQALIVDHRKQIGGQNSTGLQDDHELKEKIIVPMLYRDEVIGVIEVSNRADGLPYSKDDQDLLSTFASQAAVALENARLFTMTDQTLAERVEELSVLQRIDRELNTSLDIERALRVTLGWALTQSHAEAGLIGMIEGDKARVMASVGYDGELFSHYEQDGLPLDFPAVREAIQSSFPQIVDVHENSNCILNGALQQVVIPLRREAHTIALVLMESKTPNATEEGIVGFLDRLGDHASIAIENARLYAAVQDANQAKSDFVSFVSHELKTPMTSIRGFTDLIASGVVGQINENQANFLNTIRSNVDRMSTLVSDLTDISRIEAGKLKLEFGAIPVQEIVDEVVRSTRTQILEKKQTLILNIPDHLPSLWGDKNRLIQVLMNLVSNANKYTQAEGLIKISAETSNNRWTDGSPEVIHLSVIDNGFGISEENEARIFQKFYRSDDQRVRDTPGTGLGLNITKQLVEMQGGKIWFESKFRKGTSFHIIIPIAEAV